MKCMNCDNEARGKSKYCSDSCKTIYNRNKKAVTNEAVTGVTPTTVTLKAVPITETLTIPGIVDQVSEVASGALTDEEIEYRLTHPIPHTRDDIDSGRVPVLNAQTRDYLERMSIEYLNSKGISIPAWRYQQRV